MNTNKENKENSEIFKNRSETTRNWVSAFNTIILLIIAVSNVFINQNLNSVEQKLEDAKFFATTIEHLASDKENREIALSILYSLYVLEEKTRSIEIC